MDSTLDHLLASSKDGPGVGMGMLEGSGEVIPTAAVYRNDKFNGESKQKDILLVYVGSGNLIVLVRKYLVLIFHTYILS